MFVSRKSRSPAFIIVHLVPVPCTASTCSNRDQLKLAGGFSIRRLSRRFLEYGMQFALKGAVMVGREDFECGKGCVIQITYQYRFHTGIIMIWKQVVKCQFITQLKAETEIKNISLRDKNYCVIIK